MALSTTLRGLVSKLVRDPPYTNHTTGGGAHIVVQQRAALLISIGRLEATADADGDIGRGSTMDHSKALDLCFSEMYWSGFLDPVRKYRYINKVARSF